MPMNHLNRVQDLATDTDRFGIVKISVANIRREPVYQSELVNQTLLGTVLPIYEEQNDFYYIENWDGYPGWITMNSVAVAEREEAVAWLASDPVVFGRNHGRVTTDKAPESEGLVDLVACARVNKINEDGEYAEVALPDRRRGFVPKRKMLPAGTERTTGTRDKLIQTARQFLGIPYLWGGTSTKAFDCSGFVQTVFRVVDVPLPRNASEMAMVGREISLVEGRHLLEPGDLLFFGKSAKRTTHVALLLDGEEFIHSEGLVRCNSLVEGHERYSEHRSKTLLKARRILAD